MRKQGHLSICRFLSGHRLTTNSTPLLSGTSVHLFSGDYSTSPPTIWRGSLLFARQKLLCVIRCRKEDVERQEERESTVVNYSERNKGVAELCWKAVQETSRTFLPSVCNEKSETKKAWRHVSVESFSLSVLFEDIITILISVPFLLFAPRHSFL